MSDVGSPSQLRDSMRKMRKRVASVIRRGSSSKNVKRTGSDDKSSDKSQGDNKSHESDHDEEHASEHTPSNPNSAASSTHSLSKSVGSRPASPQPGSSLSSPTTEKVHRKRSLVNLSFPRSPSKKTKSKGESAPTSPDVRTRTFSTPGTPVEPEPGKLSIPIPARPRTLSHPLAASPIMPSSPDKEIDNVRPKPGHSRAASSPGTGAFGALASAASTLAAMAVTPPAVTPSVVLTPPTEAPTQIVESPSIISAEQPDVTITDVTRDAKPDASGQPRDADPVEPTTSERVPAREPLPREQHGVKRTASTVGSEMGWSMLEPTREEDEPEEEQASKLDKGKGVQVPVEPSKDDVASLQTDESAVKVEEPVPRRNSLMFDPTPSDEREPLPSTEGEEHHEGAFVLSPETSGQGTPQQASEPAPSTPTGIFIDTPPRETHPTWITSVTPPRAASPEFALPFTPPAQTGSRFSPERDAAFSTPDNQKSFQSSTSPGSSQLSDTPSKFFDLDGSKDTMPALPSGISTPPRPYEISTPPRSETHYPGDATPPPPAMSESFFHPRNFENLNPRHLERSMSTMGVFGDADPDSTGVQERLKRATSGSRPLLDTSRPSLDTSVHEMISPSVRGEENELRKLAGTELKDWYEGETRTPKTVRMMLPETDRTRPRSALSQGLTLEPAAEIERAGSPKSETDEEPATQVGPRAPISQAPIQRHSDRAQVYTSVLSRLMSHMDRRSSLMSRLATRLGTLGGVGGPLPTERHPREWSAQTLPSGKIYYSHRLVIDEIDIEDSPRIKPRAVTAPIAEGSRSPTTKVLVIPTPSAPLPVTLVTDLDMSDPVTHSGVNSFVDKNLQERDVDLPSGWEVWVHASGTSESLFDGSKADRWDEVSEAGTEPVDLGYGAPCVLVWTYVSHKRRRVGAHGPEDKFVTGEDAEHDLEMERRYWAYVETHPAHADVNPRATQEAIELLTWHYTDRFLAEKKRGEKEVIHVNPPFTPEESQEVLEFLKSVTADPSHANVVLKTRTVARVHVRTAEWRLAKLHAVADAVNLEVMSPSERIRRRRVAANPFVGIPLRTLASLLGLGIPYLYVNQPDEKVEDRQRMMVADASTNLMSALMLGASVSFLAIPDLEDIARLAGVAAAACSLGSLAAGIVRLRLPSFSSGKESGRGADDDEREPRPSALRTFARALPLVLSAYAGSALVAGLAAYSWRGQVSTVDDPFAGLYPYDAWSDDAPGGRWLRSLLRRESGAGHSFGGVRLESDRQSWSETNSQGLVRLWGTW
ncbi:unnamed protein product [Rhizoctonia solani]|uniref:Uncharacterized protein n=1 Tax=Rhizoctonia solani TaxID=456999 RepID=A0A8H3DYY7_9AGAM|nr:unnamed protein product [Rhizoctonia solani]